MTPEEELANTAFHESGHAVIGYRFSLEAGELSIIPNDSKGSLGHHVQEQWEDGTAESARNKAIALYAGGEAARIAFPGVGLIGTEDDDEKANDLLHIADHANEAMLRAEAVRMIQENWAQICAIAQELQRKKILVQDEWSIIVDAIDEGKPWEETLAAFRARAPFLGLLNILTVICECVKL
jgi:hypothetical protein